MVLSFLLPLIISGAILAKKNETTTVQTTMKPTGVLETTFYTPDLLHSWLEVERGLNQSVVSLDFKRAWVSKEIQNLQKENTRKNLNQIDLI